MFSGLSAFPLTPVSSTGVDDRGFIRLLYRLLDARVDSVGVLGSTGSYAYLTRQQRQHVATLAGQHLGDIPFMVCVGAVATDEVLRLADDAQQAGASALLLPALSYQRLNDEEVFELFDTVSHHVSVPVCVYDNPGTTHVEYTDALYQRLCALPAVKSIKIPGVPPSPAAASARIAGLRDTLPADVAIGVSGDTFAALGLNAGCDLWYSVIGGLFPHVAKRLVVAAAQGASEQVTALSERLTPMWDLFKKHGGSIRVMAAAAGVLGLTDVDCLPRPLRPLAADDVAEIARVMQSLNLQ